MNLVINCMHGIGDNIYARPFVKLVVNEQSQADHRSSVYLKTPLPFLFEDLPVQFIKPDTKLRTQGKALMNTNHLQFSPPPFQVDREISFYYDHAALQLHGITTHMEKAFGYEPGSTLPQFDLPWNLQRHQIQFPPDMLKKPIAVVRPVTHRREWLCLSRSPNPNYVSWCAKILREMGYYVISIADCAEGEEWIEYGGDPPADMKFHQGELSIPATLSLIKQASLVVGGSGFIIPATIAAKTPLFIIFGGRGGYDNPHKVFDLRMDLTRVGWAIPDNFCRCTAMDHDCDKTISDLDSIFFNFMKSLPRQDRLK